MTLIRALIIREEYINMILSGKKIWEIRKFNTNIRGPIALISRGYLYGFVHLKNTFKIDKETLKRYRDKHGVPPEFIDKYAGDREELYVWVLEKPLRLDKPLKISYAKGVQVWAHISLEEILEKIENSDLKSSVEKMYLRVLLNVGKEGGKRGI
ncbi:MAG: RNA-binding protein [Thermoprotei archaeon]|nr:MAG: RNA-binding protein [Thermoprotei archaeon]